MLGEPFWTLPLGVLLGGTISCDLCAAIAGYIGGLSFAGVFGATSLISNRDSDFAAPASPDTRRAGRAGCCCSYGTPPTGCGSRNAIGAVKDRFFDGPLSWPGGVGKGGESMNELELPFDDFENDIRRRKDLRFCPSLPGDGVCCLVKCMVYARQEVETSAEVGSLCDFASSAQV